MTYTPTTEDVKEVFVAAAKVGLADAGVYEVDLLRGVTQAALWFDEWYAEEIRKAKREAWQEILHIIDAHENQEANPVAREALRAVYDEATTHGGNQMNQQAIEEAARIVRGEP